MLSVTIQLIYYYQRNSSSSHGYHVKKSPNMHCTDGRWGPECRTERRIYAPAKI